MAPVRAEVTVLRRRARHLLARTALDTGDGAVAEEAAGRALADDPLDEEAVRLLMRAQLARDLPAEALRTYERLRRVLADELGTDPAPATRALYDAALHGEAPSAPDAAAAIAGRPAAARRAGRRAGSAPRGVGGRLPGTAPASCCCRGSRASARAGCSRSWPTLARRSGGAVLSGPGLRG